MIRIFALTDTGAELGQRLQNTLATDAQPVQLQVRPDHFGAAVQTAFEHGERLILICSIGIAVRTLAPVLTDKYQDPAVLVLDEAGEFVIPLLSSHEGGANDWGQQVSATLDATCVSTAPQPFLQPVYTVGMGCERGCDVEHLQTLLAQCLAQQGLSMADVATINSIDSKADEAGLVALANHNAKLFQTFTTETLAKVEQASGVAELAALWAAQQATQAKAELILSKQTTTKASCAIARAYPPGSGSTGWLD